MFPVTSPVPSERFEQVKILPEFITYCENVPGGLKRPVLISVYGLYHTGELFVRVTVGDTHRLRGFRSRHKSCPPEVRREQLPLVDLADAFAVARDMTRHWGNPRPHFP